MDPVTERERHTMLTVLDELMGPDVASTLVRHLPPGGWADVATKHDLVQLEERLTHRFDATLTRQVSDLRTEFHTEIGALRSDLQGEIVALRSDLQGDVGTLRSDLQGEIGALRGDLRGGIGTLRRDLQGEIGTLRSDLQGEIGTLRSDLQGEIGALRGEIGQVRSDMQAMTRTYILGNVGLVFTVAAIAFGAARLV